MVSGAVITIDEEQLEWEEFCEKYEDYVTGKIELLPNGNLVSNLKSV